MPPLFATTEVTFTLYSIVLIMHPPSPFNFPYSVLGEVRRECAWVNSLTGAEATAKALIPSTRVLTCMCVLDRVISYTRPSSVPVEHA